MKRTVSIEIDCGDDTCASEPGHFCQRLGTRKFGQIPICTLFSDDGQNTELYDSDGWAWRCPACTAAEVKK